MSERNSQYRQQPPRRPAGQGQPMRRPPQNKRRPPKRRRRASGRFFLLLAILALIIVGVVLLITKPWAKPNAPVDNVVPPVDNTVIAEPTEEPQAANETLGTLAEHLGNEDIEVQTLKEDQMVKVENLSINTNLPPEWKNVLLLGADARSLAENSRTDAMLICSINTNTGEVKLTSIMRDIAIEFNNLGKYSDTYRINAANFFGGAELAMKVVNESFDMNIEDYVFVNFFGFQVIAEKLGGIDIDITEAEMNQINELIVNQAKIAYKAGIEEPDLKNEYLKKFGPNTHLDGRQTLAYARIRKIDSDFSRAERQRTVLGKLMEKLKGQSAMQLLSIASSMQGYVTTNLSIEEIVTIAVTVLQNSSGNVKQFRLPVTGTYVQEKRREQSMFYDCDFATNAVELYNFIYE